MKTYKLNFTENDGKPYTMFLAIYKDLEGQARMGVGQTDESGTLSWDFDRALSDCPFKIIEQFRNALDEAAQDLRVAKGDATTRLNLD